MRIVIAGNTYLPGNNGQAIFTIHLAEGLARVGHQVEVITPGTGMKYQREQVNGVCVHLLPSIDCRFIHPNVYVTPLPAYKILDILKQSRPDVVHIQDHYFLCRDVALTASRLRIPVMGTNHFLPENVLPYLRLLPIPRKFKIEVMWQLMLWTYRRLTLVTTPTETAAGILQAQKVGVPVFPVSCGVDTNWFTPGSEAEKIELRGKFGIDPEKIMFLYVGRLDWEKRVDLLLRGLAKYQQMAQKQTGQPEIQLVIAGRGAAGSGMQALAKQLGLTQHVRFLGYIPAEQLPDLYRACDVFAMPSPEELQSIATLEAMATAKPILAANARALPELVSNGVNGTLFSPGDVDDVLRGILWLLDHRFEWERMGDASRSRALAHSINNTIRRYEELYQEVKHQQVDPSKSAQIVKKFSVN